MKLFIFRHGVAAPHNLKKYPNDAARPLTSQGERETLRAAKTFRAEKLTFDRIVSSPLLRARQTAQIVAAMQKSKVHIAAQLAPQGSMRGLIQLLRGKGGRNAAILLVGHEPYLTELISVLIGSKETLGIRLKKGGLCKLTVESLHFGRCARLDWLLTPRQIAAHV